MDRYIQLLEEVGLAEGTVLVVVSGILLIPVLWSLTRETLFFRHRRETERLRTFVDCLNHTQGGAGGRLGREACFRYYAELPLSGDEIDLLMGMNSPLAALDRYRHGRRYLRVCNVSSGDRRGGRLCLKAGRGWLRAIRAACLALFVLLGMAAVAGVKMTVVAVTASGGMELVGGALFYTLAMVIGSALVINERRSAGAALDLLSAGDGETGHSKG